MTDQELTELNKAEGQLNEAEKALASAKLNYAHTVLTLSGELESWTKAEKPVSDFIDIAANVADRLRAAA
jgi:hypothetical protein